MKSKYGDFKYIKVKKLKELLAEVPDELCVTPHGGKLMILRETEDNDQEHVGDIDFSNEGELEGKDISPSKSSEKGDEKEETLHIRLKLPPNRIKIKTFNGILTLRDVPVEDTPGADYNDNVLFLHNESEPLANLVNEFAQGEPVSMYYHITTEQTEETERLLRDISGEVDARVESELAYPADDHWIHYNRFNIGEHDLNYIFGHSIGKWIFIKLVKYHGLSKAE